MNDDQTYEFSTDPTRIDAARVHELISRHTYWAKDRPREVMDAAIAGSRPYGVYRRDTGEQVAFARIVTDGVTFAWLADVVVDPLLRGQGIGKLLISGLVADIEPLGLRRTLLATADADQLYEQFGWVPVAEEYTWMERPGRTPAASGALPATPAPGALPATPAAPGALPATSTTARPSTPPTARPSTPPAAGPDIPATAPATTPGAAS